MRIEQCQCVVIELGWGRVSLEDKQLPRRERLGKASSDGGGEDGQTV